MDTAITQFTVMEIGFLGTVTGEFGHSGHSLAFMLTFLNLILYNLCYVGMDMKVIVYFLLHKIADILVDTVSSRSHRCRAQLNLSLTFEHRVFHIKGNSSNKTVSDIRIVIVLAIKLFDGFGNMLLKGTLVSTPLGGMLTIDKRMELLPILICMSKSNLYILTFDMDDIIKAIYSHVIGKKVLQTMTT